MEKRINYVEDYLNLALYHIKYMNISNEGKENIAKAIKQAIKTVTDEEFISANG